MAKVKKWDMNAFKRFLLEDFTAEELADVIIEYMQPNDIREVMEDYGYREMFYASAKKSKVSKAYGDNFPTWNTAQEQLINTLERCDKAWDKWFNNTPAGPTPSTINDFYNGIERDMENLTSNIDSFIYQLENISENGGGDYIGGYDDDYEASTKKSKMKKTSRFDDWLKAKILNDAPYGVEFVDMKYGWNNDERVLTFRITDDRITTAEGDERFDKLIDRMYDWFDSYHGRGLAHSGFEGVSDDKTFTWGVRDDRRSANYEEVDGESNIEDDSGYWATKKSAPKTSFSFENNVNKMRKSNYNKIGNINSVKKG